MTKPTGNLAIGAYYDFQIFLHRPQRRGITVLDAVTTSDFYMTGCPSAGTSLGTYPIP